MNTEMNIPAGGKYHHQSQMGMGVIWTEVGPDGSGLHRGRGGEPDGIRG